MENMSSHLTRLENLVYSNSSHYESAADQQVFAAGYGFQAHQQQQASSSVSASTSNSGSGSGSGSVPASNSGTAAEGMEVYEPIIRTTRINKVLKMISKITFIPRDEEFQFHPRVWNILAKWRVDYGVGHGRATPRSEAEMETETKAETSTVGKDNGNGNGNGNGNAQNQIPAVAVAEDGSKGEVCQEKGASVSEVHKEYLQAQQEKSHCQTQKSLEIHTCPANCPVVADDAEDGSKGEEKGAIASGVHKEQLQTRQENTHCQKSLQLEIPTCPSTNSEIGGKLMGNLSKADATDKSVATTGTSLTAESDTGATAISHGNERTKEKGSETKETVTEPEQTKETMPTGHNTRNVQVENTGEDPADDNRCIIGKCWNSNNSNNNGESNSMVWMIFVFIYRVIICEGIFDFMLSGYIFDFYTRSCISLLAALSFAFHHRHVTIFPGGFVIFWSLISLALWFALMYSLT